MPAGPRFPRSQSRARPGANQGQLFDPETIQSTPPSEAAPEPHSISPQDYWDYYDPAATINPERPRTQKWRYNLEERIAETIFRDGTPWRYYEVHPNTWRGLKRTESPGRYINRILNNHEYGPGGWGLDDEE
jgi:hypothetical protein